MFTGLVEGTAEVLELARRGSGARLELARPVLALGQVWRPVRGESLALNGCCLSVAGLGPRGSTRFDLTGETLECSSLGALERGWFVNVERALCLGDRLGGHLVSGHVDAVGRLALVRNSRDGGRLMTFDVPRGFERYLVPKGSVSVDGVSLTVVRPQGRRFTVAVIPETLRVTTFARLSPGARVNLEADQLGKWVERLLAPGRTQLRTRQRARS